jgi:acyl carrier protein phosphodiesterase
MSTLSPNQIFDSRILMDMIRLQLNWLEREMAVLQQSMSQQARQIPRPSFKSLRGAWAGIDVSEDDFRSARFTLPDDL